MLLLAVKVIVVHPYVSGAVHIAEVVLGAVCVTGAVLIQSDSVFCLDYCV